MCQVQPPSHFPIVGRPSKSQGQPQSQLQALRTFPTSFHGIATFPVAHGFSLPLTNCPPWITVLIASNSSSSGSDLITYPLPPARKAAFTISASLSWLQKRIFDFL